MRCSKAGGARYRTGPRPPGSSPPPQQAARLVSPQDLPALILEAMKELEGAKLQVLKRLHIWKRQQQLAGNGAVFEENLAPLQKR